MGLALQLIELAGPNWEAYWPAIKQALQGLTAGSLAYVAGKAAANGLSELADRIRNYQPIATPDNPQVAIPYSVPYAPMNPSIGAYPGVSSEAQQWIIDHPPTTFTGERANESVFKWTDEVVQRSQRLRTSSQPPNCKQLNQILRDLMEAAGEVGIAYYESGAYDEDGGFYGSPEEGSSMWERYNDQHEKIEDEIDEVRNTMRRLGCREDVSKVNDLW